MLMGDIQSPDDPTLPAKRKPHCQEGEKEDEEGAASAECVQTKKAVKIQSLCPEVSQTTPQPPPGSDKGKGLAELEDEEYDGDYLEEEEKEKEVVVDRKGKGVLVVEDNEDDDDEEEDDDDESSEEDDASELEGEDEDSESDEEDPLAEVDLDNILPSRTRRGSSGCGVSIGRGNRGNGHGEDGATDA